MRTIELSTRLDAPPEIVRSHILRPALLEYVAWPMLRFKPVDPPVFPAIWTDGRYKTRLLAFGFVPAGVQFVCLETQAMRGDIWSIRDNGHGTFVKRWDHMIEVAPEGESTRYTDRVHVDAGWLTPFVALYADIFYRHRQRRWRRLVANNFDYAR